MLINILAGVNLSALGFSYDMQQLKITGTVTDESESPMPGVNIQVEGSFLGVISDVNGKYSIEIPDCDAVLIFLLSGMLPKTYLLKGKLTGDSETALRHERQIEFTFENFRWYDIRRWKILENVLTNAQGMDIVETTNKDDGTVTTTWQLINCQDRQAVKRMYWIPISTDELKKAPQLVQNPGY